MIFSIAAQTTVFAGSPPWSITAKTSGLLNELLRYFFFFFLAFFVTFFFAFFFAIILSPPFG